MQFAVANGEFFLQSSVRTAWYEHLYQPMDGNPLSNFRKKNSYRTKNEPTSQCMWHEFKQTVKHSTLGNPGAPAMDSNTIPKDGNIWPTWIFMRICL